MKNAKNIRVLYNTKKLYLVLGLFLVLLLGVGYAILNTTLSINGIAEISKNTWDVHFENVVVQDGNVTATTPATISDTQTEVTFTVPLSKPGDTYSFLVDIVNNGTIDAKLNEILKTGITTENESYLIFDVTYSDGQIIGIGDALRQGSKQTILVMVGYSMDITNDELVSTDESVSLSLKLNYVQDDGSAIDVVKTLYRVTKAQTVLDNIASTYVTANTGVSFDDISSDTNGKGVYTIASTSGDNYPISYYRGAVENNNVIFAGFCWKMVRTTSTGGVKMIYNGIPNEDGSCTATSTDAQIGTSAFNLNNTSLADVGYMYGTRYTYNSKDMSILGFGGKSISSQDNVGETNYIYSDSVTYDESTGKYTLVDGENRIWKDTYTNGGNQYKYTCLSETEASCESVSYVVISNSSYYIYYTTFTGGEMADELQNMEIVYGNDVKYDESTGKYTLVTTTTSKVIDWTTNFEKIVGANGYHYTCFTTSDTCSEVNYIYYHSSIITSGYYGISYYIKLTDGKKVEDALSEMFSEDNDSRNQNDSTIKIAIDEWYSSNMTNYTNMLEDTIWCNDRTIYRYGGWQKDSSGLSQYLNFSSKGRIISTYTPILSCSSKNDAFTVDDTVNGNAKLTYPVGLLTSDEVMYAGGIEGRNKDYYLYTGSYYWTLSPGYFNDINANSIAMYSSGALAGYYAYLSVGVRPSISLKNNTLYTSGDGTKANPYIIEKQ